MFLYREGEGRRRRRGGEEEQLQIRFTFALPHWDEDLSHKFHLDGGHVGPGVKRRLSAANDGLAWNHQDTRAEGTCPT
ncbi:hypothetical protein EYF80_037812 [Liparis tanakae]|uniref:Uncharacterized protein n=1 Tax=Liparis tanakae TaxID=230148 RepID=A0A4Z2GEL7_9TELE|nr:hypothetical protein EYF80_037812 [Liparis tanakae]